MSIYTCKKSRRQFLIGAGGTLLALPTLPSLLSSNAFAQAAAPVRPKWLLLRLPHCTVRESWPDPSIATNAIGSLGAKAVNLKSQYSAATDISPIFRNTIYNTLLAKDQISVVRGFRYHNGGHGLREIGGDGTSHPTVDWMIENSASFYPVGTPSNMVRALRVNFGADSLYYIDGGAIQTYPYYGRTASGYRLPDFYNLIFGSLTEGTVDPEETTLELKSNILNRVHESYKSAKASRKISSVDKERLERHMAYVFDIQKQVESSIEVDNKITCTAPTEPTNTSDLAQRMRLYFELLAVAFKCGLTQFGHVNFEAQNPPVGLTLPSGMDLHGAIHGPSAANNPSATGNLKQDAYEYLNGYNLDFLGEYFLKALDVEEGTTERTYIENMMITCMSELSIESRESWSGHGRYELQHFYFGSLGGKFTNGNYTYYPNIGGKQFAQNDFVITILQQLGIPAAEYSQYSNVANGFGLYGSHTIDSRHTLPLTELLVG